MNWQVLVVLCDDKLELQPNAAGYRAVVLG
uniref:Uncharacterized protein n=1 Tax=Rhizophora mucronata TaxID=61149 RepID=A0A2P2N8W8_RHIMU